MKTTHQKLHDDCAWNLKIQTDYGPTTEFIRMNDIRKERCEYCGKLITNSHCGALYQLKYKIP